MKRPISEPSRERPQRLRTAAAAVFLCIEAASAGAEIFELAGRTGAETGYTNYRIDIADGAAASLLEFPLDGYTAGASLTFTPAGAVPDRPAFPAVRFELHGIFSLTDPALAMKDSDWIDLGYNPPLRWSYTESPVEHRSVRLGASLRVRLGSGSVFAWYAAAGYEYHRVDQSVRGYEGWQLDILREDATGVRMDFSGPEEAIRYAVTYHRPSLGAVFLWNPGGGFSLEAGVGLLGVFSFDTDDHLLRGKRSSGRGFGPGFHAGLAALYRFTSGPLSPFIGLELSYLRTVTRGSEEQEWYRPEGDTPAGTVVSGIDHATSMFLYTATVRLGLRYAY